jgi:NADP-dependent 3-hydroxy acid dehydrogenase YdfG
MRVLITGATSGIGKATAKEFARHGHHLILTGRREDRLAALRDELISVYGIEIQVLQFDVRIEQECADALESLPDAWKSPDVLINNAGLAQGLHPVHEGIVSDWETMIDTNVKGLLYMTRLITPGMVERGSGHIINVSSIAATDPYPKGNVYCASKAAVDMLTRTMRLDLYTHGVRVSQVSPGHVEETEFAAVRFHGDIQRAKIYEDFQPLKSSDVAEAIYFIATRPSHVNVQDIVIMGTQQAGTNFVHRSGRKEF